MRQVNAYGFLVLVAQRPSEPAVIASLINDQLSKKKNTASASETIQGLSRRWETGLDFRFRRNGRADLRVTRTLPPARQEV